MNAFVGFDQFNYNALKNIYGASIPGITFTKAQRIPVDLVGDWPACFLKYSYFPRPWSKVNIFHCWNRIYWGQKPWGVSFESYLPRFFCETTHPVYKIALQRLGADSCRFIIAISHAAERTFLNTNSSAKLDISQKLHVVYPMQPLTPKIKRIDTQDTIKIIFIGNESFRKGLIPLLRAFRKVIERTPPPLELFVVSTLSQSDYVVNITDMDVHMVQQLLNASNIRLYQNLPHDQVLKLIDECHVLVLPTLDDSFGYVALEAMSRGRPVITTDIRALPEMNTEETGWLIDLPKSKKRPLFWQGMEFPKDSEERQVALTKAYDLIECQLIDILEDILEEPTVLTSKGEAAYERVRKHFSPEVHSQRLLEIYRSCL